MISCVHVDYACARTLRRGQNEEEARYLLRWPNCVEDESSVQLLH